MRLLSDLAGTLRTAFRVGRSALDASGLSAARTHALPNKSGTIALLDDLDDLEGQIGGKMTNPMTTAGDMIRGGTSGAPERVAAGTNGHVMTMVAGVPGWALPGSADVDFTIIYPNGGSAASPANVSSNTRYVEAHPFPGFHCLCEAEVFAGGKWLQTGWIYSDSLGSFGVAAHIFDGSLIVQTGTTRLAGGSDVSGNPRGDNVNPIFGPSPCRVKIWKVKGAVA